MIAPDPWNVTLRLLAPAGPVNSGRLATVHARYRASPSSLSTRWEWDDGAVEHAELEIGDARTRRSHRYAGPGVYRVTVRIGPRGDEPSQVRYVTVRTDVQAAASGWIRDASSATPIPFGFLITPADEDRDGTILLRCALGVEEMRATELIWLFVTDPGSLHFGGIASIGSSDARHPFRVDAGSTVSGARHPTQRLTMSIYAAGAVPGHHSPLHRLSGPVRPGRIELGPLGVAPPKV